MKWIAGSATHGCWLGIYEREKRLLLQQHLKPGMTFFDIGAHVGFYTILASVLVGPAGRVFAFEPFPRNLRYLQRHVAMNHLQNVRVIPAAVSDRAMSARFSAHHSSHVGRLSGDGELAVDAVRLDDLIERGDIPQPDAIKMDIEGGEVAALRGMQVLLRHRPILVLATHSADLNRECRELLSGFGYHVAALDGKPLSVAEDLVAT